MQLLGKSIGNKVIDINSQRPLASWVAVMRGTVKVFTMVMEWHSLLISHYRSLHFTTLRQEWSLFCRSFIHSCDWRCFVVLWPVGVMKKVIERIEPFPCRNRYQSGWNRRSEYSNSGAESSKTRNGQSRCDGCSCASPTTSIPLLVPRRCQCRCNTQIDHRCLCLCIAIFLLIVVINKSKHRDSPCSTRRHFSLLETNANVVFSEVSLVFNQTIK